MAVYLLGKEPNFPPAELANDVGIIAVGGDLSIERLINAYASGIFPWYSKGEPILWWSPNPRMVLFPQEIQVSKRMKRLIRNLPFALSINKNFKAIINNCKNRPKDGDHTWITDEMKQAYIELHKAGYAHSVEVYVKGEIVGGLYGVALGKCFFGESMFSHTSNASKYGFIKFVELIEKLGFIMIDCQIYTEHLASLGAREITRDSFLKILKKALSKKPLKWDWQNNTNLFI